MVSELLKFPNCFIHTPQVTFDLVFLFSSFLFPLFFVPCPKLSLAVFVLMCLDI